MFDESRVIISGVLLEVVGYHLSPLLMLHILKVVLLRRERDECVCMYVCTYTLSQQNTLTMVGLSLYCHLTLCIFERVFERVFERLFERLFEMYSILQF